VQLEKASADAAEFKAGYDKFAADAAEYKAGYDKLLVDNAEQEAQLSKASADAAEYKAGYDKYAADAAEYKAGYDKLLVDTSEQEAQLNKAAADAAEYKAGYDKYAADAVEYKAGYDKLLVDGAEQKAQVCWLGCVREVCARRLGDGVHLTVGVLPRCQEVLDYPCFHRAHCGVITAVWWSCVKLCRSGTGRWDDGIRISFPGHVFAHYLCAVLCVYCPCCSWTRQLQMRLSSRLALTSCWWTQLSRRHRCVGVVSNDLQSPLASAQSLLCRCVLVLAQPCFLPGLYGGACWLLHCLVVQSLMRCGSMLVRVQQLRGAAMLRMPTLTHVSACAGCTFAAGQGLSRCC
jgi:hypothetical protein